jgi:uncharacterized protein (DUF2147 family)
MTHRRHLAPLAAALIAIAAAGARAAGPQDIVGLWLSHDQDAVIEMKPCSEDASAMCGTIVWDKDALPGSGKSVNDCGKRIARLKKFDDGAWRDGWVHDPRDNKTYKGALRVKEGKLNIRAYLGVEVLGQTEELTHVDSLPAGCPAPAAPAASAASKA